MNTKSILKWLSILLVAALLAGCNGTVPVPAGVTSNGTPVEPGLYVWSFSKATEASATDQSVPTFTPTGTLTSALPTDAGLSCPIGQPVAPGNAFNHLDFVQGNVYHLNLSLEGAPATIEGNLLFRVDKAFPADFDGMAELYPGVVTDPTCQMCDETQKDYVLTLEDVPQLTGYVTVLNWPCTTGAADRSPYKVHKLIVGTSSIATDTPIAATPMSAASTPTPISQASNCPGIVAQGQNQTLALVPGVTYGFSWYYFGNSTEYVTLVTVDQNVTASAVNGTVSCWLNTPSRHDTGIDNANHEVASLQSMMEHVSLSSASAVTEVPFPQ